jgi:hypothetical protein
MMIGRRFPVRMAGLGAMAALLLSAGLAAAPNPAAAARADQRTLAPRAAEAARGAGWGPFSFGMSPAAAQRVARTARARLAPMGRAGAEGSMVLRYRGPRPGDQALLEFQAGRLARVTVPLLRAAAPDRDACRALHEATTEHLRVADGAPPALLARVMAEPGMADGWSDAVRQPRPHVTRVSVETVWEEPEAALDAGGEETCVSVATHLPPE